MIALGTVRPGRTIYIPFESFASSTGAPITLTGLATSDILVYKDGGTTERASASGYTLLDTDGIDFDGKTGIHGVSISLADNTTAGFWGAGSRYFVVIGDVTVDSQTMRFVAAEFTIGYPGALLDTTIATLATQTSFTLTAGPAEDDALNGCLVVIHDVASAVQMGLGLVSDYTGASKTVTLAAGVTFTVAVGDNISMMLPALQPTVAGRTADVSVGGEMGLDWANVGTPGSTVGLSATTVATVTTTTTATNVTTVNGLATNVITATSIAADAITDAKVASDVTIASVTGAVGSVTGSVGSVASGGITAASIAADAIGASELAADALAEIADAVLDEVIEGSTTLRQALRGFAAALLSKASGLATTTAVYRDVGDTKDRITATVDVSGNRSAVTLDLT